MPLKTEVDSEDLPPGSTACRYFDRWRCDGALDTIHDLLRRKVRTREEPYHPRTSTSVDSQSIDTTSGASSEGGTTPGTSMGGSVISSSTAWVCCWPCW